ncbi:tetratricopeptide repeat-containing response regulator [Solemya pervernicosa gill symbiont]|nr:tetratricopeptide repeat-containing response regulator [Solemya pervernicosa gill symbiont]
MAGFDLSKMKALVIDDFNEMRRSMKRMLEELGVKNVDMVANAREALAKIALVPYDIILCDYNLGDGRNGQQILEEVKERGIVKADAAYIMVTAEMGQDMVLGAVDYLPDDYLTKPFVGEVLNKRINKVLARKAHIGKIEVALQKTNYDLAIKLCDENLAGEGSPYALDYLRLKGEALLLLGECDKAHSIFSSLLERHPFQWATFGLGRAEKCSGNNRAAAQVFEELIDENNRFMTAYDQLAECHQQMGDTEGAQRVLSDAISISPRSVQRQREFGKVAFENDDLEAATLSFRRAVTLSHDSYLKSMDDYTNLARTMASNGKGRDALVLINKAKTEFKGKRNLDMQTAVVESLVHQKLGDSAKAQEAMDRVGANNDLTASQMPLDITLDLAGSNLERNEKEKAMGLLGSLLKNFYEDDLVVDKIRKVFNDHNLGAEGDALIREIRSEITDLNNRGVSLVKEGNLDDAIGLFEEAANRLPKNKTVNLNAAQVVIMQMQKLGANRTGLQQVNEFLDRVRDSDPANEKLVALQRMATEL